VQSSNESLSLGKAFKYVLPSMTLDVEYQVWVNKIRLGLNEMAECGGDKNALIFEITLLS